MTRADEDARAKHCVDEEAFLTRVGRSIPFHMVVVGYLLADKITRLNYSKQNKNNQMFIYKVINIYY